MDHDGEHTTLLKPHATNHHNPTSSQPQSFTPHKADTKCTARSTPECGTQHTYSPPHKQQNQCHTPTKTSNAEPLSPQEPLIDGLSEKQSKYKKNFIGLVMPSGLALAHPAAPMLVEFATVGCDAAINTQWTLEMIEAVITRGTHPSAQLPEPAAQLRQETPEKIEQGYAHLVAWDSIKDNPLPNLKISPIAAIPHKSHGYRMILDLSYGVTIGETRYPSVNESTKRNVAPSHAMTELGRILP